MKALTPVVLITGASRGIGRSIAVDVARMGYSGIINYARDDASANETLRLCMEAKVSDTQRFVVAQADIRKKEDRGNLVKVALDSFGHIDALINNAGVAPRRRVDMTEVSEESFEELMGINLIGPHFLTQLVVNHWLKARQPARLKSGYMVAFMSSVSAEMASPNRSEYCISKAGLAMVSQLWATRLAAEGIKVYELRPGIIATDMTAGVREKYENLIADGLVPQRRWGEPGDVSSVIHALLEGAFTFSTGQIFYVDGGLHMKGL